MDTLLGITKWNTRITTDKGIDWVKALVETLTIKYIIGTELSTKGKLHYHIYMEGQIKNKEKIKECMNGYDLKGNKAWFAKECYDGSSKIKKYCVKDGNFIYRGFDSELMDTWKKLSNQKAKDGLSDELNELEDEYVSTDMTRHQMGRRYLKLCAKYGYKQGITRTSFQKYINYMYLKKDPEGAAHYLVNEWMD